MVNPSKRKGGMPNNNAKKKRANGGGRQPNQPKAAKQGKKKVSGGSNRRRGGGVFARAIMDPSSYPGQKWPDDSSLPSATFQSKEVRAIATGAAGVGAFFVCPSLYSGILSSTSMTAIDAVINWNAGNYTAYTQLSNIYTGVRCTGLQVSFYCTQNALEAAGEVYFAQVPQVVGGTTSAPTTITLALQTDLKHLRIPVTRAMNTTISGHAVPIDPTARDFRAPLATVTCEGWTGIMCAVGGAKVSSTIGYIEIVANWELLPGATGLAIGVTPAAHSQPGMLAEALNMVSDYSFYTTGAVLGSGAIYLANQAAGRVMNGIGRLALG